jgi:hypothetical protein
MNINDAGKRAYSMQVILRHTALVFTESQGLAGLVRLCGHPKSYQHWSIFAAFCKEYDMYCNAVIAHLSNVVSTYLL